jgi:RNA polymerase sigma-70 factor (ECF subfamily)
MGSDPTSRTSTTLLREVCKPSPNDEAWNRFVERYRPQILAWCRKWARQHADAEDVTQEVLTKLVEKMRTFRYDPSRSFRGWLRTVAHNAWCDWQKSQNRAGRATGTSQVTAMLETVASGEDLVRHLDEAVFGEDVLEEAMLQVRQRVEPHTWDAFRLVALEGMSPADAACQIGIDIARVHTYKNRVLKRIKEAVRALEGLDEPKREE